MGLPGLSFKQRYFTPAACHSNRGSLVFLTMTKALPLSPKPVVIGASAFSAAQATLQPLSPIYKYFAEKW